MKTIPYVDEQQLVALIHDPKTAEERCVRHAACRGQSADLFFSTDDDDESASRPACCALCPVTMECLATALTHERREGYRFGWWGGLRPMERESIAQDLGLQGTATVETDAVDSCDPTTRARVLRTHSIAIPAIAAELGCSERTVYRYLANVAA